jgi:hypothetical protein
VALSPAEGIDTEYLFGFTIGSDIGEAGAREFQVQISGGCQGRRKPSHADRVDETTGALVRTPALDREVVPNIVVSAFI